VLQNQPSLKEVNRSKPPGVRKGLHRRLVDPIMELLRMGASPERLAWSITAGLLIGINPLFGSATILCLLVAALFRLNVAASQLGNYLVYPLQLALAIPFLQLGSKVFHTAPLPLSHRALMAMGREHPVALIRQIWSWEWHALIVWSGIAIVLTPLIALTLRPLLARILASMERPNTLKP
jgi:uncharacterized protein (DUF2062 family)